MKTGLSPAPGRERLFQHDMMQPPAVFFSLQPCECQHVSNCLTIFWYVVTRFSKALWHYHITLNSKNKREQKKKKKSPPSQCLGATLTSTLAKIVEFIIHLMEQKAKSYYLINKNIYFAAGYNIKQLTFASPSEANGHTEADKVESADKDSKG